MALMAIAAIEMSFPKFEIAITSQGWITDEPGAEQHDLCSHGNVRVVIAGSVVAPGDGDDDYTLSTSALALLRTVESDHTPARPVADSLILHCGQLLMTSCPIGIDWQVTHSDGHVRLSEVVRNDDVDVNQATRFPGLVAELPEAEYRHVIAAFASSARQLFVGIEKRFHEDFDRQLYDEFWAEYDERLSRALDS